MAERPISDDTPLADILKDDEKAKLTYLASQVLTMRDLNSLATAFEKYDAPDASSGVACCCCCCGSCS